MNKEHKKLVLRYAQIIAKGDNATKEEQEILTSIEDQMHRTKDSILREATVLALATIK